LRGMPENDCLQLQKAASKRKREWENEREREREREGVSDYVRKEREK
jgi:hypothetical protein